MITVDELLEKYRSVEMPERDKGTKFERLMKNFLLTYPVYRGMFSDVWLWNEFPFRDELGTVDLGIDIVCKAVDGEFWAVQCKFYAETSTIDKAAVDSFLSNSSRTFGGKNFSARLWISTSDNLTDNAEKTLQNQSPPVARIGVEVIGDGDYRVKKMRLSKDKTTLTYNRDITIKNIPPRSFEYVVNGRSPLEWIIDRYQIKTDSASGIVNNPNDWAIEHDNPRYILDLILSSITVSLKTLDIVYGLPTIEF